MSFRAGPGISRERQVAPIANPGVIHMDLTTCPECAGPAEVEWRDVVESTDNTLYLDFH